MEPEELIERTEEGVGVETEPKRGKGRPKGRLDSKERKPYKKGIARAAKKYDPMRELTLQDKAFAALQLLPMWTGSDAYRAVFSDYESSYELIRKYAYRRNIKEGIKQYKAQVAIQIAGLKGNASIVPNLTPPSDLQGTSGDDIERIAADSTIDKAMVIKRLYQIAKATTDPKVEMQALEKIANIDGMKREQSTGNEQQTVFYLPLRCRDCSLHRDAVLRGDVEDEW